MIASNNVLFCEKPFVSVTKVNKKERICSNCFKEKGVETIKLYSCTQCKINYYCDRNCQKKDWKLHKWECKPFKDADFSSFDDVNLLILRIIIKSYLDRDKDTSDNILYNNNIKAKPRKLVDLMTNVNHENSSNMHDKFITCFKALKKLVGPHLDLNEITTEQNALELFGKSITNNFEIQNKFHNTIGYGCYLNASSLNHSCWPNAYYTFEGNRLVLQAMKDISPTDEIFINYIDTLQLRKDRKTKLFDQYLFDCQCEACCNDELESQMNQLNCEEDGCNGRIFGECTDKFQCTQCRVIVTEEEMEMRSSICKAKLYHLDNLMNQGNYQKAYELSRKELDDHFSRLNESINNCGLYELKFGEMAFESAIFNRDYGSAFGITKFRPEIKIKGSSKKTSWIAGMLSEFLGTPNHALVLDHQAKYEKLLQFL